MAPARADWSFKTWLKSGNQERAVPRSVRLAEAERVVVAAAEVDAAARAVVVAARAVVVAARAVVVAAPVDPAAVPAAVRGAPAVAPAVVVVVVVKVADAMGAAVAAEAINSLAARAVPISSRMWSRSTESPRS